MDDLLDDVRMWLLFKNAEGWLMVMGKDFLTDKNVADATLAWDGANTYRETELGTKIWGGDDRVPESWQHRWLELHKKDAYFGVPGAPMFRYTAGNDFFYIGDSTMPVSAIPALIQFLQALSPTSLQPVLTDAAGHGPPNAGGEGIPVTNIGLAQRPSASQELKEMEQRDRERAMNNFVAASCRMFPGKHDR